MLIRIRKALVAGFGAGVSAVVGGLVITGAPTKDDVSKATGTFIVAAAVVGWATFKVKNAPAA